MSRSASHSHDTHRAGRSSSRNSGPRTDRLAGTPARGKPARPGAGIPVQGDLVSLAADDERITVRIDVSVPGITSRRLRYAVRIALAKKPVHSLSIAVVDDATIARLHARYLGQPGPTDVISFDLRDDPETLSVQGEIVISAETARRQAHLLHIPLDQEVLRYAIHGTLHLLGLDDRTPGQRRRMRREENRLLAALDKRPETRVGVGPVSPVGPASSRSKRVGPASSRSKCVGPAFSRSKCVGPAFSRSKCVGPAFSRSKCVGPASSRSKCVGPASSRSKRVGPASSRSKCVGPASSRSKPRGPGRTPSSSVSVSRRRRRRPVGSSNRD